MLFSAVRIDDQVRAARVAELFAAREVEVRRAEDVFSDADVAYVGVIAFEGAFPRGIDASTELDAAVAVGEKPVAELELEVADVLVLPDELDQAVDMTGGEDRTIHDGPVADVRFRGAAPAVEALAVEHADVAFFPCPRRRAARGATREGREREEQGCRKRKRESLAQRWWHA